MVNSLSTNELLTYQFLQILKPAVSQLRLVYSARTQGQVGKLLLFSLQLYDLLLPGVFHDISSGSDFSGLAESMDTI